MGREQQRGPANERGQRDRRHLPVPVDAGVNEERRVGAESGRSEPVTACRSNRQERSRERAEQDQEADRAELCKRLEVEAVGIEDR